MAPRGDETFQRASQEEGRIHSLLRSWPKSSLFSWLAMHLSKAANYCQMSWRTSIGMGSHQKHNSNAPIPCLWKKRQSIKYTY